MFAREALKNVVDAQDRGALRDGNGGLIVFTQQDGKLARDRGSLGAA